jgi:integrase
MRVEHLRRSKDGWRIAIPGSKDHVGGVPRLAWLSPRSEDLLKAWLKEAGVHDGPIFRAVHLGRLSDQPLDTSSIRRLTKRAALRAGLSPRTVRALSGHSMRIGAAQDMIAEGIDSFAIMQAGGWTSPAALLRYLEQAPMRVIHDKRWKALNG